MLVRHDFLRSAVGHDGKPPLARLIRTGGEALRLYLHGLFIAQALGTPGTRAPAITSLVGSRSNSALIWPALLALPANTERNHRLRVQRTLRRLNECGLAAIPRTARGDLDYGGFLLLEESGGGARYVLPGGRYSDLATRTAPPGTFAVPVTFFTRGWSLVLSDTELTMLLFLYHLKSLYGRTARYVFMARQERLTRYGISDEVYLGHRGLEEFGLVTLGDVVLHRRRGRIKTDDYAYLPPYRFDIDPQRLDRMALTVVSKALGRNLAAPHLRISEGGGRIWLPGTFADPPAEALLQELNYVDLSRPESPVIREAQEPDESSDPPPESWKPDVAEAFERDPSFGAWYFDDPEFLRVGQSEAESSHAKDKAARRRGS
ncbi:hypothetical protein [Terrabacter sp. 2TAF16]|uniref:hypothetical protein n=1 Tax=Terrabacter sp. 2TAF16 TaxID=3233008 RepID=UPI003F9AB747